MLRLQGYAQNGPFEKALDTFKQMEMAGKWVGGVMFNRRQVTPTNTGDLCRVAEIVLGDEGRRWQGLCFIICKECFYQVFRELDHAVDFISSNVC
ncbi:hypothetical protein SUGI_0610390 [Cryptomeria japonica]|nr:hypothetical protein SUGI_0610390 [Cryptomeria japonica]